MSMRAVGTSEKIGAQLRRTTGGKVPEHLQFVLAQLEQWQQSGYGKHAGWHPTLNGPGWYPCCCPSRDRASSCQSARGELARVTDSARLAPEVAGVDKI